MYTSVMMLVTMTIAVAQNTTEQTNTNNQNKELRSCFVDANNNGICDNFENGTCTIGNGKGLMDGSGNRVGRRDGSGNAIRGAMGRGSQDGTGRRVTYKTTSSEINGTGQIENQRGHSRGGYGPQDGTGNRNRTDQTGKRGTRPMNGTGFGATK